MVCAARAVFEVDRAGQMARFRFNNADRTSLCELSEEDMELFYTHQPTLDAAINHADNSLAVKVRTILPCPALLIIEAGSQRLPRGYLILSRAVTGRDHAAGEQHARLARPRGL